MNTLALLQLFRLTSPALPIGAYSYSQGLESAIEHGWVHDTVSAEVWLVEQLDGPLTRFELPLLGQALAAAADDDAAGLASANALWLASREAAELYAETVQTGYSLKTLLLELPELDAAQRRTLTELEPLGLPVAWALASRVLGLDADAALAGYVWAWLENQVMVLMKALPMGQLAGQKLFSALLPRLAAVLTSLPASPESGFAPGLAWLSMRHETQYSRLFRS
ncbi:urease accessory UreF family protein [Crenobacter sp. SG2305]|uniref:urease accessory protein UreF n=1 Tax=Crenobacter oryzisoli TaxID=3056844 RepID=UPI0025AB16E5|nr:urease accessory UreF family protein [Crenobacter sp. SG2305]MDN0083718.1 urease accessory UreF family protein [Crenobacter sp. SG2305]